MKTYKEMTQGRTKSRNFLSKFWRYTFFLFSFGFIVFSLTSCWPMGAKSKADDTFSPLEEEDIDLKTIEQKADNTSNP